MRVTHLLLIAVVSVSVNAQVEHAPTVAKCQADQRLWLSELESIDKEPLSVVVSRLREMHRCLTIDHDNQLKYHTLADDLALTQGIRMRRFLLRHDLYQQFLSEDAEGKRRLSSFRWGLTM